MQTAPAAPVVLTREGPILTVTIDRLARRNAVDRETALALYAAFKDFEADDALSVAILTGAGGTFCAGADLQAVAAGNLPVLEVEGDVGPMGPTRLRLGKPVIAAIEGYAVAGGLELACWCDLRVASSAATLGVFCRRLGVPLIDGGTIRLPRLIGAGRALDLILTGRAVSAEEAHRIGLVDRLASPGEALAVARTLALELAAFPQACLRADRQSALAQWGLTEAEALRLEFAGGAAVLEQESLAGAQRFTAGAGRHGRPVEPGDEGRNRP